MAEVLSQSEIDALLSAVSTGTVDTAPAPEPGKKGADWIAYDLASQEKIVRARLVGLQGIHERFARHFRMTMTSALKKSVTVNMTNIDFVRFGDYLSNILLPASINIYQMPELRGSMLFVVNSKFAYAMMDAYYGGNERPFSKIGGREEFTSVENNIIKKISALALTDIREAWKLNYPLDVEYVRTEANPHFIGCIHSSELVAVVTFEAEFENLSGNFVIIIQLKCLEPIQQAIAVNVTGEVADDVNSWRDHWMAELMKLELSVRIELGHIMKSLRQVHSMKVGEELILNQDHAAPLQVMVQDLPKFQGLMGTYRGARAVRLLSNLGELSLSEEHGSEAETTAAKPEEGKNG